jgi:hypothetical protein
MGCRSRHRLAPGPRKLRTRWETRDDIHEGFLQLAHSMILARKLPTTAF